MAERFDLKDQIFAHRGLWSRGGPPENSLAAFEAAARAGLGAELDVRLTADGVPLVFHDPLLDRMTDGSGLVAHTSLADIRTLRLKDANAPPPTLAETFEVWPHHLPLLVELKTDGRPAALAAAVAPILAAWPGHAAVMSFDLRAVESAFPASQMIGGLIEPAALTGEEKALAKAERARGVGVDFLGVNIADLDLFSADSGPPRLPLAVWTVDAPEQLALARRLADAIIFEKLSPALVRGGLSP